MRFEVLGTHGTLRLESKPRIRFYASGRCRVTFAANSKTYNVTRCSPRAAWTECYFFAMHAQRMAQL